MAMRVGKCLCICVYQKEDLTSQTVKSFAIVNLGLIQKFIDSKKLDPKKEISEDVLVESGIVRRKLDGVRILGKGVITSQINISVSGASRTAIETVEKLGGVLKTLPGASNFRYKYYIHIKTLKIDINTKIEFFKVC
jgi:ribosomal protein L15